MLMTSLVLLRHVELCVCDFHTKTLLPYLESEKKGDELLF
jgi:hypothetical protein